MCWGTQRKLRGIGKRIPGNCVGIVSFCFRFRAHIKLEKVELVLPFVVCLPFHFLYLMVGIRLAQANSIIQDLLG